jgi:Helicase conserved C-terminal domain/Type III restriction enzyme, res subunit
MKQVRYLLAKADIPAGAHWISVHPNGTGKGQPVLIQPQADGSAKVIGGAGGSLNHLRLRGVKSQSDYKAEATEKAADKRKAKKEQTAADKASGVHEAKEQARKDIREQKKQAEHQVIEAVAKKAGWDDKDIAFPEEDYAHMSEAAQGKMRDKHHAKLLSKAKDFIQQAREKLVNDSSARTQAGIGEIPLFSDKPDDISVEDLAPEKSQTATLGFNADYKGRAEAHGLTEEALAQEAQQVKLGSLTPEQRAAAMARGKGPDLIKQELEGIKEPAAPNADASLLSAKDALDLVKEGKRLSDIEKQARAANADIDKGAAEPKAFVLETSDDAKLDQSAKDAVINDLRTAQTVAFLSEVGKIAGARPNETLGGHIGVGAYNSINALALAVGGEALVDRSVVDVLGIAGAAQVLARRLHADLSPEEAQHVTDGMQDWHLNHYMQTSTDALKKARELTDAATAIEPDAASGSGRDLSVAQELNARRRSAVGDAQRILGQALGEMESNAALVMAMKQGGADKVQVSLGKTSPEQAIKQVRAIGLMPGDYTMEKVAGDTFLTVTGQGMDRLAKPVNREDVQQVKRNLSIVRGGQDEDGWLPLGVANRPDLSMEVKPGVVEQAEAGDPEVDAQKFDVDQKSVDALHRALAQHPEGVAAYKQIGELTHKDRMALRGHFEESHELPWREFVKEMGGSAEAYTSAQDMVRSKISSEFAAAHNKLKPDAPIKIGKGQIRGGADYAAITGGDPARATLGENAENQIAGMMGIVGQNFKPGQPTKLWNVSMSGKYAAQQRAIKLVAANKRIVLAAGAGSGKTNMMLGAHAHLAGLGKVKRSLMLVPSIVQGQFNGEALRLLEPGKFKTHIQPGASQAERIAAYKDPDTNIAVMTHQSFRDDMLHLGAKQAGVDEAAMTEKLQGMSSQQRKEWVSDVMSKEGINFDASFVDEAHDTLNRAGKENSSLSNIVEAVGHNTPYHVYASGDPVKNDPSEIHSMLQKMDPERYADRAEFMRRYGADTISSKQALQREMARYVFPTSITPDVDRDRKVETIPLSEGQKQALGELDKHLARARAANRAGKVDVEAAKAISPGSFDGVPESEHETVAKALQKSVGILKSSAINRIINSHPDNAKVAHAVKMVKEREGKQGVIFARNRESIEQYKKALEAEGKRVVTITGSDSAADKDRKRRMFNPEKGKAQADILIASDAGAVGMNLQSGQYLIQHDISQTAKTHSQRNARIDRLGQKNAIELIDLVGDHKEERKSRDRLMKKYALKEMMASPLDGLDDTGVAAAIHARRVNAQI